MRSRAAVGLLVALLLTPTVSAVVTLQPARATLQGPAAVLDDGTAARFTLRTTLAGVPDPFRRMDILLDGVVLTTVQTGPTAEATVQLRFAGVPRGPHELVARAPVPFGPGPLGWRSESAPFALRVVAPPGAPTDLAAAPVANANALLLTWSPPADDGGLPVTSTTVYRRAPGEAWLARGSASGTTFEDLVDPQRDYEYVVAASHALAQGPRSEAIAVRSPPTPAATEIRLDPPVLHYCEDGRCGQVRAGETAFVSWGARPVLGVLVAGGLANGTSPVRNARVTTDVSLLWEAQCPPGMFCIPEEGGDASASFLTSAAGAYGGRVGDVEGPRVTRCIGIWFHAKPQYLSLSAERSGLATLCPFT